tara:strand:+ start:125 stop:352 length:228 start_codon:yes stop_codon:yes gene_type:complete
MKNRFKEAFSSNEFRDLKNFMFAKDYWKHVDKNSDSVKSAINNSLDIGRKSVKTATALASATGILIGAALGTIFE